MVKASECSESSRSLVVAPKATTTTLSLKTNLMNISKFAFHFRVKYPIRRSLWATGVCVCVSHSKCSERTCNLATHKIDSARDKDALQWNGILTLLHLTGWHAYVNEWACVRVCLQFIRRKSFELFAFRFEITWWNRIILRMAQKTKLTKETEGGRGRERATLCHSVVLIINGASA